MILRLDVKPIMTNSEIKQREGEFFDLAHYNTIITQDTDVYITDDQGQSKVLFHYRKGIIPDDYLKNALRVFKHEAIKGSSIRGKAGGVVDPQKISPQVMGVVNPKSFKSRVIYKNGETSKYYVSNKVNSLIAGYFDKPKLSEKSQVLKTKAIPCRLTSFTEKNFAEWSTVLPLIKNVSQLYSQLAPTQYQSQKSLADLTPQYVIPDSPFSTLTINANWRTACHVDTGDYDKGLSVILVAEEGQYQGGHLGYPQYGICIDLRHGDFLLKNPHEYHCNTMITPISSDYMRLAMVFYYRYNIRNCAVTPIQPKINLPKLKLKLKLPIDFKPKLKIKSNDLKIKSNDLKIKSNDLKIKANPKLKPKISLRSPTQTPYETRIVKVRNRQDQNISQVNVLIRPETTDIKVISEVLEVGCYQRPKLGFFVEANERWLDLGGNIGTFALLCLINQATVISYEPELDNLHLLRENLELNFPQGNPHHWDIVPMAVSSEAKANLNQGLADFYLCKGDYNKYRHTLYPRRGRTSVQIPIVSIQSVFQQYPDIDCVKIDIEGAEIDILESMDWSKTKVKKLVFEYSFDICRSIPRFLDIIKNLRTYFTTVSYGKVKETELLYTHFPAMTMVYCLL